jgi:hypothetical protein
MIPEKIEDINFCYLYIKSFRWTNPEAAEVYAGHPKVGEVYRTIYNPSMGLYRLMVGNESGLKFHKLISANEGEDHQCEMIEITRSNIIQLDLPERTLDKMIKWMDTDNKDLKKWYEPNQAEQSIAKGLQSLSIAIHRQDLDETKAMREAETVLKGLYIVNTNLFNLVLEIADKLGEWTMMREGLAVTPIALGPEGKGYNIANAMDELDTYLSPVKQGGDDRGEVIAAIMNLFTELERREIQEEDE